MPVPTARHPEDTRAGLAAWLVDTVPGAEAVQVTLLPSPGSTGYSCETVLFDVSWRRCGATHTGAYAARVHPVGYSLYQEHDLDLQWRVMDAVGRHSDLPVPRIVGHQTTGPSRLGQPFFVMERVEGRAPADSPPYSMRGWLHDAEPADQRLLYLRALELLARIDLLDWRAIGLGFLADRPGGTGIGAQVEGYATFVEWVAGGRPLGVFEEAYTWLRAHLPADPGLSFNWGDARIGNILFRRFTPVAVLDWEMASLGPPEADLAWWLVFNRIHTTGRGRPGPAGFPSEAEAVERYQALTGVTVRRLDYYMVWAALRAGLLLLPEGGPPAGREGAHRPTRPMTPGGHGRPPPARPGVPARRIRAVAPR
jgi:aminoglycoside phosphotransferase (APT) family kinase protein